MTAPYGGSAYIISSGRHATMGERGLKGREWRPAGRTTVSLYYCIMVWAYTILGGFTFDLSWRWKAQK
jgi:hypothetical protein